MKTTALVARLSVPRRGFLALLGATSVTTPAFGRITPPLDPSDPIAMAAFDIKGPDALVRLGQQVRLSIGKTDLDRIEHRIRAPLAADPDSLPDLISADLRAGRTCTLDGLILSETETAIFARC